MENQGEGGRRKEKVVNKKRAERKGRGEERVGKVRGCKVNTYMNAEHVKVIMNFVYGKSNKVIIK